MLLGTYLVTATEMDSLSFHFIPRQHWAPNTSPQLELGHSFSSYIQVRHGSPWSSVYSLSQSHATAFGTPESCWAKMNLWNSCIASPGSFLEIHCLRIHPTPAELESTFLILSLGG